MPPAVITFQFDPLIHLGDRSVRLETVALALAVLVSLAIAALIAGRSRMPVRGGGAGAAEHLRRDDLLFVVLGIVPGAVVGGRLSYVALNLDYYQAHQAAILDPSSGGLGLSGAVVLGALTGSLVARLFEAPLGRWFRMATVPTLLVLALGKVAELAGGSGQGLPNGGQLATRYLGDGPWGSLGPAIASYPSQVLEAVGVGIVLAVVLGLWALGAFRAGDSRPFALGLAGWALVRFVVSSTWRDPAAVGSFRAEQVIDLAIIALAIAWFGIAAFRSRRNGLAPGRDGPVASGEPGMADGGTPSTDTVS